jgi:hypothetical protein
MLVTASFVLLIRESLHAITSAMKLRCFFAISKHMSMINSIVMKPVTVARPTTL